MDQQSFVEPHRNVYAFDGQTLIMAGIATVFLFVVFLVGLHVYARWWLRRGAAARRTHVFVLADNHHPASADRGLDPAVLSSLPVFTFSSKAAPPAEVPEQERALLECAVCLSEFEDGEVGRLLPKCRHSFHIGCIDMWFHSHSTCPLCRSPVESLVDRAEPNPVVVVEVVEGSSSGSGLCETCEQHEEGSECGGATSLARRRKAAGVKIEVAQPRFETELTQGSPSTRMLSFKRLLSMGGISPSGSRASPRYRAGTSRAAAELDLEGGLGEPVRAYTPKRVDSLLENRS